MHGTLCLGNLISDLFVDRWEDAVGILKCILNMFRRYELVEVVQDWTQLQFYVSTYFNRQIDDIIVAGLVKAKRSTLVKRER